jgi:aminoglycoside phosphotransferase (APT) family kinase protein
MAIVWRRTAARWRARPERARSNEISPIERPSLDQRLASRGGPSRGQLALRCALVPRVLADAAPSLPPDVVRVRIAHAQLTGTRMTIVTLAASGEPACAVIKLPTTAAGARELRAEGGVLAALHADGRLGDWPRLVPRPLASGSVSDQPYRVDSHARGHDLAVRLLDPVVRRQLLEAAAAAIHVLHRRTASTVTVDAGIAERWVDACLADLVRGGAARDARFSARAERLRAELRDALVGRTLTTSWIHGDYWAGNVLFSPDGATVQGVVDWAGADAVGLPLHDLLHLVLYTRQVVSGRGLGQIVRAELRAPSLCPFERSLLERYGGWSLGGLQSYRHALVLYWLRHVALHARQQEPSPDWRYRLWERRNVHAVLGAL